MVIVMLFHYLILIVFNLSTTILAYKSYWYTIADRTDDDSVLPVTQTDITRVTLDNEDQSKELPFLVGYVPDIHDNVQFTYQTIATTVRIDTVSSPVPTSMANLDLCVSIHLALVGSNLEVRLSGWTIEKRADWLSFYASFEAFSSGFPVQYPFLVFQNIKKQILMGETLNEVEFQQEDYKLIRPGRLNYDYDSSYEDDTLAQYPSGGVMHAELFQNKTGVHLPLSELMHRRHCYLKLTNDYMQTAVDAFGIFLEGTIEDVMKLPQDYVLLSARTIAMMKIAKEKLVATWEVVKGDMSPDEITYEILQLYRPLFKYVNGREIARLNLKDERILNFIGTYADLNRHQVGVIASRYIEINRHWYKPRYLNQMNNLLCGVPMTFMRKIPESTYLQLTHQVFYHIKACDPLQRRFYLTMMTKTQVLGKSYSWSARDVSRLGLLLSEVDGPELAAVNPEAMAGLTAQVSRTLHKLNSRKNVIKPLSFCMRAMSKKKLQMK